MGVVLCLLDTNRQYVDMTRSFATPLPLLFNPSAHFWHCMLCTRCLWLLFGGRRGGVDVLIGNKRCAFLLSSVLPVLFREDRVGRCKEDMSTLKADIFVFVCTGGSILVPLDEGLVSAVFFLLEPPLELILEALAPGTCYCIGIIWDAGGGCWMARRTSLEWRVNGCENEGEVALPECTHDGPAVEIPNALPCPVTAQSCLKLFPTRSTSNTHSHSVLARIAH
jgi:hypothetical protein